MPAVSPWKDHVACRPGVHRLQSNRGPTQPRGHPNHRQRRLIGSRPGRNCPYRPVCCCRSRLPSHHPRTRIRHSPYPPRHQNNPTSPRSRNGPRTRDSPPRPNPHRYRPRRRIRHTPVRPILPGTVPWVSRLLDSVRVRVDWINRRTLGCQLVDDSRSHLRDHRDYRPHALERHHAPTHMAVHDWYHSRKRARAPQAVRDSRLALTQECVPRTHELAVRRPHRPQCRHHRGCRCATPISRVRPNTPANFLMVGVRVPASVAGARARGWYYDIPARRPRPT